MEILFSVLEPRRKWLYSLRWIGWLSTVWMINNEIENQKECVGKKRNSNPLGYVHKLKAIGKTNKFKLSNHYFYNVEQEIEQ